ncbi:helix-turn-helix transcriptional regulator [Oricola indica]|jgi:DNA-binding CsgD family transcriptional regulator|uniref:helix-turn-helix transcriptional regulator n=1 Tax=Oricola indica TaxID=2872591 RepID=UPI001CC055A2|nr:helix-turn-helix transcriptional regulator [Oricola indica]
MNETTGKRRAYVLAVLIVANMMCAVFFAADVIADFEALGSQESFHLMIEAIAAVVLVFGTGFLLMELRRLLQRNASMEIGIRAARGEMQSVIDRFFSDWGLSDAERDVALLLLKGLDNEAIASIRGTATGTVRAQCARIYAKAGVDGRSQLMSVFMEELLSEPLGSAAAGQRAA